LTILRVNGAARKGHLRRTGWDHFAAVRLVSRPTAG
jgi:hypothetical protein